MSQTDPTPTTAEMTEASLQGFRRVIDAVGKGVRFDHKEVEKLLNHIDSLQRRLAEAKRIEANLREGIRLAKERYQREYDTISEASEYYRKKLAEAEKRIAQLSDIRDALVEACAARDRQVSLPAAEAKAKPQWTAEMHRAVEDAYRDDPAAEAPSEEKLMSKSTQCICGSGNEKGKHHESFCPLWLRYMDELNAEVRRGE
jgi:chromosome segregation ATPase